MSDGDDRNDDSSREQTPSPRTTIVGGRPPEEGAELPPVPRGLPALIRLASVNEGFCEELVHKRAGAAQAAGVELTLSEQAMLAAVPEAQLRAMIEGMPPPPVARREFLRQAAASAVVALGGAAFVGSMTASCEDPPILAQGIRPDMPPPRPEPLPPVPPAQLEPQGPPQAPPTPEGQTEIQPPPPVPPPTPMQEPQITRPEPHATRGIRPDFPRPGPAAGVRSDDIEGDPWE